MFIFRIKKIQVYSLNHSKKTGLNSIWYYENSHQIQLYKTEGSEWSQLYNTGGSDWNQLDHTGESDWSQIDNTGGSYGSNYVIQENLTEVK